MQNNTFFGHYQSLPVIVLEETPSTNDYSKQLLTNFKPQIDFTAIMAKHQTQGRGQRGTTWSTTPYSNMTASFLYSPHSLFITDQFLLTIHSSLAVYDVIKELIPKDIYIKWPNDIMVERRKIAGILIENKVSGHYIKSVIAGIGINVYESNFPSDIARRSTSLVLENSEINLTILDLVKRIQHRLYYYQNIFSPENRAAHLELYNERLFLKGITADFMINGASLQGQILGVESDGQLIVRHQQATKKYDLKGITYQL
ncbi:MULTISPECIES: biotin--[acetyl-CoA-carboxylase] ligase [Sphingobacterium]|uniref:biotin--[acetyl-CoA-carboxylase] ligase n=1 Tax=Sphingobacterium TaxID=28453 RepID=UPI0013DA4202|nr:MULTISPECIES: biotin--[acetyl-CoA-carboxylase] ligase [unclassified Sphingobacterium]